MLGMMPRKSAFNFAKGKKQLSVPQHSAAFLLVIFWSSLQVPQQPKALPEGSLAPQRSAVHLTGHPLGKVLLFPRPHSIFSMKKTAWGSCFPPHWLKLYGLVMSLAEWQRDGPNQKCPDQQRKQHITSGNSGSESPPCREGSAHRDGTWGRKLPVRPWSRSADRHTSNLGPAERILGPLPMETLLVLPTNGWHWPCQGQGWRHRHGQGALSRSGACLPHGAGTSVHL